MAELESPTSVDELYRYRGAQIPRTRPIFQGDVFDTIAVPGLDDGLGLVMVITHACSMRAGAVLQPRLVVARVSSSTPIAIPWFGNFRVLPLPDLLPGSAPNHWSVTFEELGTVPSESLVLNKRVACLDDQGVLLLQQRHTHHLTRYVVETAVLYDQCANVLAEAELLEDWLSAAIADDADDNAFNERSANESSQFDAFVRPHREELKVAARRPSVRRIVNQEIQRRFG